MKYVDSNRFYNLGGKMKNEASMRRELTESLNFVVNSGYYNDKEIEEYSREYIIDIFNEYDLGQPTKEIIQSLILNSKNKKDDLDYYNRLRHVFDQLNGEGIIAIDYAGFDISEGHEEVSLVLKFMQSNNIPRIGYCFCHQQDIERCLSSESSLLIAFGSMDEVEEKTIKVGMRIVALLRQEGFDVKWDGTTSKRISVEGFKWDKQYSGELCSTERSLEIMKQYLN